MASYMYKYVLSNGRFYVGRDKVNEFLRAKDHLQNALSVVDKTIYPDDFVIKPGKITWDGFHLMDTPQKFESAWGSLICSDKKTAQQILLPFHINSNETINYELLQSVINISMGDFSQRRIFNNATASFYRKDHRESFISQLQDSLGDDDLIKIMKRFQTKQKRMRTEGQSLYREIMGNFAQENNFVLAPSAYKLVMWSAVPVILWRNASCFQLDKDVQEILQQAGAKYGNRFVTTLPELLLIVNAQLFNNDLDDVIESLLTMQAYSIDPSNMANINFGNTSIINGLEVSFNGVVIGNKIPKGDSIDIQVDEGQLAKSLLQGMVFTKSDVKFSKEQLANAKKTIKLVYKNTDTDGTTKLWNTADPQAVKIISKLVNKGKAKIQSGEVKKATVNRAIDIEEKKIYSLDLGEALERQGYQDGMQVLRELTLKSIRKFFNSSASIEKIWNSFAKQKEMLRLTLSEVYYDVSAY